MSTADLSIIVPAFNEAKFIARQMRELRRHTPGLDTQIIVVDNGSTDGTRELAREAGADLVLQAGGTVGANRNLGVRAATAPVLAFMDADVFPTEQWRERIAQVVAEVRANPDLLTGSWVSVPDDCSWLERHWFLPLEHGANTHMNSGHMIISRQLFDRVSGFDPKLRTGEDFDISMRAIQSGAALRDDVTLKVIHEGFPHTLAQFFRRETWHGAGDWQTMRTLLSSKVAAVGFVVFHSLVAGLAAALLLRSPAPLAAALALGLALSAASSWHRYRRIGLATRLVTTILYFVYFIARGLSPYAMVLRAARSGAWRQRQSS